MKHGPKSREHELNRREFVRPTLMSSAMLMGPMPALEAAEIKHSASPAHAALRSLAPGAVRPEGWLILLLIVGAEGEFLTETYQVMSTLAPDREFASFRVNGIIIIP